MKYLPFPNTPGVIAGSENNPDLFIRSVTFNTGYSEESFHTHSNTFEFYVVLSGSITFENGKHEQIETKANSLVYFDADEPHRIVEVSSQADMLLLKKIGADKSILSQ